MRLVLLLVVLITSGCSTRLLDTARQQYFNGSYPAAINTLSGCEQIIDKDKLLCLMEEGTIYFSMENYPKSTNVFLSAEKLMDTQDQISVLDQTSAVVINDQTIEYKGEYAERLWVHTYLMMNFLLQAKFESSLVEAKQALQIYSKYPQALRSDFFSRSLIALSYENMAKFDDAAIEYKKLAEDSGKEEFSIQPNSPESFEAVLFISQGTVPCKIAREFVVPPSIRISLPEYTDYKPPVPLQIRSEKQTAFFQSTTDLGLVAKQSLQQRVAEFTTRQAIRAGAKETFAQAAGQYDALAEALVRVVMFVTEQADTRSWQTLPGGLTLARLYLSPGTHTIAVQGEQGRKVELTISGKQGTRSYYAVTL